MGEDIRSEGFSLLINQKIKPDCCHHQRELIEYEDGSCVQLLPSCGEYATKLNKMAILHETFRVKSAT